MSKSDRIMPHPSHASNRKFYTARGFLTRYALACGYVDRRGTDESGASLEQISDDLLRVAGDGRWIREEATSYHTSLTEARRAFMALDHVSLSAQLRDAHLAYLAEVRQLREAIRHEVQS